MTAKLCDPEVPEPPRRAGRDRGYRHHLGSQSGPRREREDVQLPLFPVTEPEYEPEMSIAERFAMFHGANPHVADALEALAAQWLAHHRRVGMKALVERLRWESGIQTSADPFKINNSYTALYARLLILRHPEWRGAIQTRTLRAT